MMRLPALALLCLCGSVLFGCQADPIIQPLKFSHKKHIAEGLKCDECHKYYKDRTFSGLPKIATCLDCHEDPQGKSAEEEKVRTTAKAGKDLDWNRLLHLPSHVYYSHRRHVVLGKLKCETCHGEIGKTDAPPPRPLVDMTMQFCIDCHVKMKVPTDCISCHR